ncbi:histidine kinase [Kineosporia sp. NBRC 101731]|uniref:sensor histidine kinase n=1 Tax=Kineosporia sp. NBRC 101731 TaxID=3032199 RepID=UPI0024A0EE1E|nr:histidine kinase [Kineosporia sp. NBRC 101731]GLY32485.1 two-component sensor histidine kinase [Kineosporia sp. NBRC 101731]
MAQLLHDNQELILSRYGRYLDQIDSFQLADAPIRHLIMTEARVVLDEMKESMSGHFSRTNRHGVLVERRITTLPGSEVIHPTDSLVAAGKLIRSVTETMAACLAQLPDSARVTADFTVLLNETTFAHILATSQAYANQRLEEIRLANEEERLRISRELHDRVGNTLSLALRQIETAQEITPPGGGARQVLRQAQQQVSEAMETTRHVLAGLRLQSPKESLKAALDSQIGQLAQHEVRTEVTVNGDESWLSDDLRGEVFLIVNEAVRNALTHSDPDHLFVSIEILPRELRATIEDDGSGFDTGPPPGDGNVFAGTGLRSMQERAQLVGARLRIHSQRRYGTRLDLIVPLPPADLVRS